MPNSLRAMRNTFCSFRSRWTQSPSLVITRYRSQSSSCGPTRDSSARLWYSAQRESGWAKSIVRQARGQIGFGHAAPPRPWGGGGRLTTACFRCLSSLANR
eukprot:scaffold72331_cov36-Phaeocystis_antarctica.AAC.1